VLALLMGDSRSLPLKWPEVALYTCPSFIKIDSGVKKLLCTSTTRWCLKPDSYSYNRLKVVGLLKVERFGKEGSVLSLFLMACKTSFTGTLVNSLTSKLNKVVFVLEVNIVY
jgi:hypothetical protein